MDDYNKVFSDKSIVMVVTAHPDDLDAMCGGTVARLVADGKKVISVKATTGNYGSREHAVSPKFMAEKRLNEDKQAMKKLGIKPEHSINLGLDDGCIENTKDTVERISYYIRKFQPQIIITLNPSDMVVTNDKGKSWVNHRDHRNIAAATMDATYPFSRDRSFFVKQFEDTSLKPSTCNELLFADFCSGPGKVSVQIDNFVDQKLAAIECHASQFTKESASKVANVYNTATGNHTFETFRHVNFG